MNPKKLLIASLSLLLVSAPTWGQSLGLDRIAVVVYGEVIACDTPAAIRENTKVQEAYLGSHAPEPEVP